MKSILIVAALFCSNAFAFSAAVGHASVAHVSSAPHVTVAPRPAPVVTPSKPVAVSQPIRTTPHIPVIVPTTSGQTCKDEKNCRK